MKLVDNKNNTIQRRRLILQKLTEEEEIYVSELSNFFEVSEVTIRNDLLHLEEKNLLLRVRGGAIKLELNSELDKQYSERTKINFQQKSQIGKSAAKLIDSNNTIIIGSGTTTAELARNISNDDQLTIITNSIPALHSLLTKPNLEVIVLGGRIRKNSGSLAGPLAERMLENFYVDKVFLGADGCDLQRGMYISDMECSHLMQLMISNAKQVILLADSSKFRQKSLALVCPCDKIDIIVTDEAIAQEDKRWFEEHGISVIIA